MSDTANDGKSVVHRKGFTKVRGTRYESVSGERVRIERQGRMHKFDSGYQDTGPAVPLLTGTIEDARLVYDVLDEWFGGETDINRGPATDENQNSDGGGQSE